MDLMMMNVLDMDMMKVLDMNMTIMMMTMMMMASLDMDMIILMVATYASATCEQPACLSNEPLHIGEALLPKVERNVNDVCHKAKCCKTLSEKSTYH